MRRLLFIAIAAAVVIAAAAISGIGQPAPARGDTLPPRLVTTTGHGDVTAVPDVVTVTAGVQSQAATAAETLAQNSTAMQKVVAALQQANGSKLQTQQVSLYPRTNNAGDVIGYSAQDSVSAESSVADAGQLIDAAVGAGANTIDGPTLSISNQDDLYHQALKDALADAKAKATALGEAGLVHRRAGLVDHRAVERDAAGDVQGCSHTVGLVDADRAGNARRDGGRHGHLRDSVTVNVRLGVAV